MPNPTWPVGVPNLYQANNWMEEKAQLFLLQETDGGVPKSRPHPNPKPAQVTFHQILTRAETKLVDTFYETTLDNGTLPFDTTDPREEVIKTFRIKEPPVHKSLSGGILWTTNYVLLKLE